MFPGVGADGSGNGLVDMADYVLWRARQGTVAAAAAVVVDDLSVGGANVLELGGGESPSSEPVAATTHSAKPSGSWQLPSRTPAANEGSKKQMHRGPSAITNLVENDRVRAIDGLLFHWINDHQAIGREKPLDAPVRECSVQDVDQAFAPNELTGISSNWGELAAL